MLAILLNVLTVDGRRGPDYWMQLASYDVETEAADWQRLTMHIVAWQRIDLSTQVDVNLVAGVGG